jgi:hypothetical protein
VHDALQITRQPEKRIWYPSRLLAWTKIYLRFDNPSTSSIIFCFCPVVIKFLLKEYRINVIQYLVYSMQCNCKKKQISLFGYQGLILERNKFIIRTSFGNRSSFISL